MSMFETPAIMKRTMFNASIAALMATSAGQISADPQSSNPGLAHRVDKLEAGSMDTQSRIEALEAMVSRLHRHSAAVYIIDSAGSSSAEYSELEFRMNFCTEEEYFQNGADCTKGLRELSVILDNSSEGTITTFSAASHADFNDIVSLLTNGDRDFIDITRSGVGSGGGGSSSGPELSFFYDFLAAGALDLAGYNITRITLAVDRINIVATNPGTQYSLDGRLFFEFGN